MKQKLVIYVTLISLVVVGIAGAVVYRYKELSPISSKQTTPIVSYRQPAQPSDPPSTLDSNAKKQANAPGQKTPTIQISQSAAPVAAPQRTDNSPKQTAIRQSIAKEFTYYALATPNDPAYSTNWALQKVNAPAAWNIATGNGTTVVADIDTGFALNHEDLKDSWYINPGETGMTQPGDRCWTGTPQDKRTNNCDNDGDGYKNNWRGWNFYLGDNDPSAGRTNPNGIAVGHGTETAGLIGATGNNGLGTTTIDWNTKIMPLQVLSDDGPGYTSDIAAAIYYAVDHGANVINMSLGGSGYDPALKTATDYAYAHNVVVVAAAGNCGTGTESGCSSQAAGSMSYPALNDHVVSVGATTSDDQRASFSSYGPGLNVTAPGSGTIVSPTWTPANSTTLYAGALYGTSFAAPQVSSLAALIKSIRPNSSTDDVRALLLATASKEPAMNGSFYTNQFGHGIINAGTALAVASSLNTTGSVPSLRQAGGVTSEHSFTLNDILGSGCVSTSGSYCAVWMRNDSSGYERYLPYQQMSTGNSTGWTWPGQLLTAGSWKVNVVQGDNRSGVYELFSK